MKKQSGFTLNELLLAIVMVVGGIGWVANIVKLVNMADGGLTAMLVVRVVGIFFAPLGVVMGFL